MSVDFFYLRLFSKNSFLNTEENNILKTVIFKSFMKCLIKLLYSHMMNMKKQCKRKILQLGGK